MAITIQQQPDQFFFVKNPQIINATLSAANQGGSKAFNDFVFTQDGIPEDTVLQFTSSKIASTITWTFKATPSGANQKKVFPNADFTDIKEYVRQYIIPEFMKLAAVLNNYDIQLSATDDTATVRLIGKEKGLAYGIISSVAPTIDGLSIGSGSIGSSKNSNAARLKATWFIYRMFFPNSDSVSELSEFIGDQYAQADGDGKTFLQITPAIKSYLSPQLFKGRSLMDTFPDSRIMPHFARLTAILTEEVISGSVTPGTEYLQFAIINGAVKALHPSDYAEKYWQNEALLTNMPQYCRVSPLMLYNFSYLMPNNTGAEMPGFAITRISATSSPQTFLSNGNKVSPVIVASGAEIITPDIYQIDISAATQDDENALTVNEDTKLSLNVDHRVYEHENFFIFFNQLGGTDIAWMTGAIEIEVDGQFYELNKVLTGQVSFDSTTKEKISNEVFQTFRINTGWKTKSEIQWLAEIINSDLINWYTRDQFRAHIQNIASEPETYNPTPFTPIIIEKSSVNYYAGNDGHQSFTFSFTAAANIHALITLP